MDNYLPDSFAVVKDEDIKHRIKRIKTYDDYVMIYLDEEKIMISLEAYFRYNISKQKGLDDNLYDLLKKDESVLKAYRGCLRKISLKDMSEKMIGKYLDRYELDHDDKQDIIEKLKQYGFIDDEKYALSAANHYDGLNYSTKMVRLKLKEDGILEDIINKTVVSDYEKEYRKAMKVADKILSGSRNRSFKAKKQHVLNKLMNSGFTYEISKNVVDNTDISSENEIELLKKEYLKTKKRYERKYSDYQLREKVYSSLIAKGFNYEDIKKVVED